MGSVGAPATKINPSRRNTTVDRFPPSALAGAYRDVALPDRLVYTSRFEGVHLQFRGSHLDEPTGGEMEQYETVITVEFRDARDGRTQIVVTHAGYRTEADRDRHREGWPRFLEHLADYCAVAWIPR